MFWRTSLHQSFELHSQPTLDFKSIHQVLQYVHLTGSGEATTPLIPPRAWITQRDSAISTKLRYMIALPLASVAALLLFTACSSTRTASPAPDAVIWEAWEVVKSSYVNADLLDAEVVTGGVISGMLDFAKKPAYPFLTRLDQVVDRPPRTVPEELADLWRAWTLFRTTWPDVDPELLSEAALHGMMSSLGDPVSTYLTTEAYEMSQEEEEPGSYEGIGAVLGIENGQLTIMSPMSGGPADRADLRRGDVILAINGELVAGKTPDEATEDVRGDAGTRVTFLIRRSSESEPREISLTRATIDIPTVDMSLLPGSIGYLHIAKFRDNTLDEVLDNLETFNRLDTLGVILDLRSNLGGSLEVARDVASQFLGEGLFLYEVDSNQARTDLVVTEGGIATEVVEMVVLVNESTAEAAEALAGALQDSGRAVVMGDPTQGRGSTNIYRGLSNGGALYLPVSYWHTPSGRSIIDEGIKPNIEASLTSEDFALNRDSQLIRAYEYLNEQLPAFR